MNNMFDSPNIEHKMKKFPCIICLVKPTCSDYTKCELITQNRKDIFNWISMGMCPDCATKNKIEKIQPHTFQCMECNHKFKQHVGELMERI